jgi:uncharacterized protein YdbL (DUF1318 family)
MNVRHIFKICVLLIACMVLSSQFAGAANIKERMKQRLPVIKELKTKGIIGENNRGYLGFVGAEQAQEAVVAAENKDRKAIYTHFAKQQKTTVEFVEKVQAERKAQKAITGQFFQTQDGQWVKK